MAMLGIQELRSIFPQYNDRSDEELARAYHAKLYSDMDYEEFQTRFAEAGRNYSSQAGSRSSRSSGGKRGGGGVSNFHRTMARLGFGYDKETGLYYHFRVDEDGKRTLDFSRPPATEEQLEEVARKASGIMPFQRQPAQQPALQQTQTANNRTRSLTRAGTSRRKPRIRK